MQSISLKRRRFPSEVIGRAIWLYAGFTLSFRDVEEMLAERGVDVSYETVRRWFMKFGTAIAAITDSQMAAASAASVFPRFT